MISVVVTEHNKQITSMTISGHANSAEYGKDLICAAVSAISFGLCNALDEFCKDAKVSVEDNLIRIECDNPNEKFDTILQTGLIQLKTVQECNNSYLNIKQLEV